MFKKSEPPSYFYSHQQMQPPPPPPPPPPQYHNQHWQQQYIPHNHQQQRLSSRWHEEPSESDEKRQSLRQVQQSQSRESLAMILAKTKQQLELRRQFLRRIRISNEQKYFAGDDPQKKITFTQTIAHLAVSKAFSQIERSSFNRYADDEDYLSRMQLEVDVPFDSPLLDRSQRLQKQQQQQQGAYFDPYFSQFSLLPNEIIPPLTSGESSPNVSDDELGSQSFTSRVPCYKYKPPSGSSSSSSSTSIEDVLEYLIDSTLLVVEKDLAQPQRGRQEEAGWDGCFELLFAGVRIELSRAELEHEIMEKFRGFKVVIVKRFRTLFFNGKYSALVTFAENKNAMFAYSNYKRSAPQYKAALGEGLEVFRVNENKLEENQELAAISWVSTVLRNLPITFDKQMVQRLVGSMPFKYIEEPVLLNEKKHALVMWNDIETAIKAIQTLPSKFREDSAFKINLHPRSAKKAWRSLNLAENPYASFYMFPDSEYLSIDAAEEEEGSEGQIEAEEQQPQRRRRRGSSTNFLRNLRSTFLVDVRLLSKQANEAKRNSDDHYHHSQRSTTPNYYIENAPDIAENNNSHEPDYETSAAPVNNNNALQDEPKKEGEEVTAKRSAVVAVAAARQREREGDSKTPVELKEAVAASEEMFGEPNQILLTPSQSKTKVGDTSEGGRSCAKKQRKQYFQQQQQQYQQQYNSQQQQSQQYHNPPQSLLQQYPHQQQVQEQGDDQEEMNRKWNRLAERETRTRKRIPPLDQQKQPIQEEEINERQRQNSSKLMATAMTVEDQEGNEQEDEEVEEEREEGEDVDTSVPAGYRTPESKNQHQPTRNNHPPRSRSNSQSSSNRRKTEQLQPPRTREVRPDSSDERDAHRLSQQQQQQRRVVRRERERGGGQNESPPPPPHISPQFRQQSHNNKERNIYHNSNGSSLGSLIKQPSSQQQQVSAALMHHKQHRRSGSFSSSPTANHREFQYSQSNRERPSPPSRQQQQFKQQLYQQQQQPSYFNKQSQHQSYQQSLSTSLNNLVQVKRATRDSPSDKNTKRFQSTRKESSSQMLQRHSSYSPINEEDVAPRERQQRRFSNPPPPPLPQTRRQNSSEEGEYDEQELPPPLQSQQQNFHRNNNSGGDGFQRQERPHQMTPSSSNERGGLLPNVSRSKHFNQRNGGGAPTQRRSMSRSPHEPLSHYPPTQRSVIVSGHYSDSSPPPPQSHQRKVTFIRKGSQVTRVIENSSSNVHSPTSSYTPPQMGSQYNESARNPHYQRGGTEGVAANNANGFNYNNNLNNQILRGGQAPRNQPRTLKIQYNNNSSTTNSFQKQPQMQLQAGRSNSRSRSRSLQKKKRRTEPTNERAN